MAGEEGEEAVLLLLLCVGWGGVDERVIGLAGKGGKGGEGSSWRRAASLQCAGAGVWCVELAKEGWVGAARVDDIQGRSAPSIAGSPYACTPRAGLGQR